MRVEVRTQAEMEDVIKAGNTPICVEGRFVLSLSMRAELWGNSSAELLGNSSAVLRENSSAVLRGNSSAELWGDSKAIAFGAAIIRVFSCLSVVASHAVTVVIHGCKERIQGGVQIEVKQPTTAREWCEFYGVEIVEKDGCAILFKGVGDNWKSPKGGDYTPGTVPRAPDWDGGTKECGGGFHFSPHPVMTLEFNSVATKFVACPVRLDEIVVHANAKFPNKVKAAGCCGPCWEVDRDGKRVGLPYRMSIVDKEASDAD